MKKADISIIMPCYNAGQFLTTAIESVLTQGVPIQLIAVDDGSADNTLEILAGYSGDIQVLKSDHQGVANARNKAIDHINSRYTLLLDADDALAPGSLGYLLQQGSRNDRAVVYGNFSSWDKTLQKKLHVHKPASLGKSPLSLLVKRNISPPGAILFPTDAFARIGRFDQTVASCEDWDFVIRLARAGYRFIRLNREIFYYRRLLSSASNQAYRMLVSGCEVIRRCHERDGRITGDLYADGYNKEQRDANLLYYHAVCMGISSLSSNTDIFREIVHSVRAPVNADWVEFGKAFRLSVWWNSLAVEGDQEQLIREAQSRSISLIKQTAGHQEWCRNMVLGILSPDFRELLLRPGPRKALRLFREWKMARQIVDQLGK